MGKISLSSVQAVVAITAGVLSVVGGAYSLWQNFKPAPATGQVLAIVREWRSEKPVSAATVEILTAKDELVTTLTSPDSGRLQHALKEGPYRVRVSHPRFSAENTPLSQAAKTTVDEGVGAVKRFFKDLGF